MNGNRELVSDRRDDFDRDEDCWTLVPAADRPGVFVCVFADGSFAEWVPDESIAC